MKNSRILVVACVVFASAILIMCENSDDAKSQIKLVKAHLGGCNIPANIGLKDGTNNPDTVIFSTTEDSLDVYVGINYLCCAGFEVSSKMHSDSITIALTDTCSDGMSCYCKCDCYYTWDFMFTEFEKKEYYFKIILLSPQNNNIPKIIVEGILDLEDMD